MLRLIEHRRRQAGVRYRRFTVDCAESARVFLRRHGALPGVVDPNRIPYYLLIVGDPDSIPFNFQQQLSVSLAVGRVFFKEVESYTHYAESLVDAETRGIAHSQRATFFAVQNDDDAVTVRLANQLIIPLAKQLSARLPEWTVEVFTGSETTKPRLRRLIEGEQIPSFLLISSHGLQFPPGHNNQEEKQGSIVCREWSGPRQQTRITGEHYFSADDIDDHARFHGLIVFLLSDFSGGTPSVDDFLPKPSIGKVSQGENGNVLAPKDFIGRLPQRLLSHPNGGALAIVARIQHSWTPSLNSSLDNRSAFSVDVFEDVLTRLFRGRRIGHALRPICDLQASTAVLLADLVQEIQDGAALVSQEDVALLWARYADARSLIVLGDPAVRIPEQEP